MTKGNLLAAQNDLQTDLVGIQKKGEERLKLLEEGKKSLFKKQEICNMLAYEINIQTSGFSQADQNLAGTQKQRATIQSKGEQLV